MTKTKTTSYAVFLCMAIAMTGFTLAEASEVTGTLSSDTSSSVQTTGSIEGTVTSDSSNSSGGSRGGGSGSSSNAPTGSVLGAETSNVQTPGFPNAGIDPSVGSADQTLWSTMRTFFRNLFSF